MKDDLITLYGQNETKDFVIKDKNYTLGGVNLIIDSNISSF